MRVSIIIASYRQPHFLGRAIESCLEQDHDDLEVIVVEDRSRDASLGLALSYARADSRVVVIECGANGGLGKARNIGISHATGEYLCFLDSDDYLLNRSLSARIDALPAAIVTHGDNLVGVYGDWQHVAEDVDSPTVRAPRATMPLVSAATYTGENVFICSAPLVKRTSVETAGGFPEGLPMLEDFSLWAKIISGGGVFAPVHHVVATYRQRANSMLRGDGAVVMADYVNVINQWVVDAGVPLADGGAMDAWLADETPFSHGRMSWNTPSILGNLGGSSGAPAVYSGEASKESDDVGLPDFMTDAEPTGLESPWPHWTPAKDGETPEVRVVVRSICDAVKAVAVANELAPTPVEVATADSRDWTTTWPLALAGIAAVSADTPPPERLIDFGRTSDGSADDFDARDDLLEIGVRSLWPDEQQRSGSWVYVPPGLHGYAALDAWVSTALHALADAGLEPAIMCDPLMRPELSGYRVRFLDLDALRGATLVVTTPGPNLSLIETLAPTAVFAPSNPLGTHARTRGQLDQAIRARRAAASS